MSSEFEARANSIRVEFCCQSARPNAAPAASSIAPPMIRFPIASAIALVRASHGASANTLAIAEALVEQPVGETMKGARIKHRFPSANRLAQANRPRQLVKRW
jgi:hypothetical protein